MRYIPTNPTPPASAAAVRAAVRAWRAARGRSAWASRARPRAAAAWLGPLARLRAAVRHYACALRARGAPPERMLVQVEAYVREVLRAERWDDPETARALTAEVVRWSVDAYYDG